MNAYSTIDKRKANWRAIIRGAGTITFDQNMRHIKIASDADAMRSDWKIVSKDLRKAWRSVKEVDELNAP